VFLRHAFHPQPAAGSVTPAFHPQPAAGLGTPAFHPQPGRASRSELTRTVPAAQWEAARQQPTRYELTWKPAPEATTLRIIVQDVHSGRYGSLDVPLNQVPRDRPN
jgi:hypothetical protein